MEAGDVHAFVVGSITIDVGSQSAVLVSVAVGLMLVTGAALEDDVWTGAEVTTGAEVFETVTNVETGVDVAGSTLVGADDSVAGAEVTAVELATELVSTAEEDEPVTETECEVTGLVGSSELVELTGTLVTGPVGALVVLAGTLVGMLVGGLVVTGGSLLVELPTGTSELVLVGIGGSEIGMERLRPVLEVEEGTSEEVALPTSEADVVGVEVGIKGGRVVGSDKGRDRLKLGRRPFEVVAEEAPVPESDVWTGRPDEV